MEKSGGVIIELADAARMADLPSLGQVGHINT
jgi:hypothetical protein